MKRGETYRKHAFIRALGITTLLLVMLVSTASASASSTNYSAEITPSFSSVPLVAGEPVTFTANIRSLDQNGYTFTGSCDFWDTSVGDFLGSAPIIDNTATISGVTFSKGSHNIMMVVSGDTYYAPNAFEFNLYVEDPNWLSISYHIQITPSPTQPVAGEPITLTANYISWDHPGYTFTGTCGFTDMSASSPVYLGSAPIINNTATLSGVTFSPGSHEIMVLGGDDHYIPTSFSIWLDVDESVNVPEFPSVANFSSNVTSGYAPLSVQFTDLSENTTGWNWDFGDGFNSTQQNPAHTYLFAGNYTVNLTATNANSTDSKLATISVSAQPVLPVFPGYINPPKDLDQDDLYEDINGNGILDFDDVVAYYDNMDWIEENVPLEFFDYNNNSLIDFDDVVNLYDML